MNDHLYTQANQVDLDYFIKIHEFQPKDKPEHTAEKWDERAEAWEKDSRNGWKTRNSDRIDNTVNYLRERGLLQSDMDVADIGCGPGRFAAEFAKTVRSVTGFDISEKMVHYGNEHIKRKRLSNVELRVCDFRTMDIEKEGLSNRFDLVFCSLTPAIHGMSGLDKIMRMSRKYCVSVTHLYRNNQLEDQIMREVFGRARPMRWNGRWFYSLFNILFLTGYYPETSYFNRHQERHIHPGSDYVQILTDNILLPEEQTRENKNKIIDWLHDNLDKDGMIAEKSDTCYGRILWDVRHQTERPDYRTEQ